MYRAPEGTGEHRPKGDAAGDRHSAMKPHQSVAETLQFDMDLGQRSRHTILYQFYGPLAYPVKHGSSIIPTRPFGIFGRGAVGVA